MMSRNKIPSTQRWVVKIGSALLTADGKGLARERLSAWVEQMATWVLSGKEVVLVSSGAVAEGMSRMGWDVRPKNLHELQAAAAIGQMGLVQAYETCFQKRGLHTAQVLLTHDDLTDRERYLNARSTLRTLLELGGNNAVIVLDDADLAVVPSMNAEQQVQQLGELLLEQASGMTREIRHIHVPVHIEEASEHACANPTQSSHATG